VYVQGKGKGKEEGRGYERGQWEEVEGREEDTVIELLLFLVFVLLFSPH